MLAAVLLPIIAQESPPFKLRLSIPTGYHAQTDIVHNLQMDQTFHVVFHNISKKPRAVLQDGSSWANENLTFEFRKGDRTWVAKFGPAGYSGNAPVLALLQPDEVYARPVKFLWGIDNGRQDTMWNGLPPQGDYELRAIYRQEPIGPNPPKRLKDLWVGEVKSPPIKVRFEGGPTG